MKLGTLAYLPPRGIGTKRDPVSGVNVPICSPATFLSNVRKFKTKYPVILYGDRDHDWGDDVIRLYGRVDEGADRFAKLPNGQQNSFVLNNVAFFTGLRVAYRQGITHVIYLEADCRVGCDDWDAKIFDAHFKHPRHVVCTGSAVCYNPCNAGTAAMQRWCEFIGTHNKGRKNFPIPTYGWKSAADGGGSCVFVNGAGGSYDVAWLLRWFGHILNATDGSGIRKLSEASFAWDFQIGLNLWVDFGIAAYDMIQHTDVIYSSYGDVLSTPADRMKMLRDGKVALIHQIKGDETV